MKRLKDEWLQLAILAAPFCVAALLWDKLPERIPIHWNVHGQVDGYAGKAFGALFVPMLNVAMTALIWLLSFIDPKVRRYDPETKTSFFRTLKIFRWVFSLFLSVVALTVLGIGVGLSLDMSRVIWIGMALLFMVVGNVMGKLRPNYFVGVRTPWTLESREVWIKTHRLAGRVWVAGSVLLLAGCLILPSTVYLWLFVSVVLVMALVPIIYSFVVYKRQQAL